MPSRPCVRFLTRLNTTVASALCSCTPALLLSCGLAPTSGNVLLCINQFFSIALHFLVAGFAPTSGNILPCILQFFSIQIRILVAGFAPTSGNCLYFLLALRRQFRHTSRENRLVVPAAFAWVPVSLSLRSLTLTCAITCHPNEDLSCHHYRTPHSEGKISKEMRVQ